ncbi:hypothetical protein [Jannaschia formosa]|uniref:hypothetical protein n=1 Tax=Jannaschia formosa TaxID=2259592 RepID=UPI000E1C06D2|nr:hypothetical protein [Jannaschia formosa]TFL17277.1 hypothetical protein DR046_15775 [Jannaschia formosa]
MGLVLSGWIAGTGSALTAPPQQFVEIAKGAERCPRLAERHAGAGSRVEHPFRDHHHDAGRDLDADEATVLTPIDALQAHSAAEQGVPTVMNDGILPDMGRMDG